MRNANLVTFVVCWAVLAILGTPRVADGALGDLLRTFPNPGGGETFGYSVAGVGGKVLAGDPRAATAYLLDGGTGAILHTFQDGGFFGFTVAAVGNNALVGALYSNEAHLFNPETGQPIKTWVGLGQENFGYSVGSLGSNALVGATNEGGAGEAYVFDSGTGALLSTFHDPNPAAGGCFGYSIAGVGGNVVVGAPYLGAAYLFDGQTGTLIRSFLSSEPPKGDYLGLSVAPFGGNILIGAPGDDTGATDAGAVYLYDGETGVLLRKLLNPSPGDGDYFGRIVAAVGDDILVGAPSDDTKGLDAGAAYLFDGETGDLLLALFNPDLATGGNFGGSAAALGNDLIVGADTRNINNAVYLFEGVPEPATLALLALGGLAMLSRRKA